MDNSWRIVAPLFGLSTKLGEDQYSSLESYVSIDFRTMWFVSREQRSHAALRVCPFESSSVTRSVSVAGMKTTIPQVRRC